MFFGSILQFVTYRKWIHKSAKNRIMYRWHQISPIHQLQINAISFQRQYGPKRLLARFRNVSTESNLSKELTRCEWNAFLFLCFWCGPTHLCSISSVAVWCGMFTHYYSYDYINPRKITVKYLVKLRWSVVCSKNPTMWKYQFDFQTTCLIINCLDLTTWLSDYCLETAFWRKNKQIL